MEPPLAHLIVVDDNNMARRVLVRQLEKVGFAVEGVPTGSEALDVVIKKPLDLILLDFVMEPMDGLEVLERIRRIRGPNQLPVIMMSATRDALLIARATYLGANEFLFRPLQLPLLQSKTHPDNVVDRVKVIAEATMETTATSCNLGHPLGNLNPKPAAS